MPSPSSAARGRFRPLLATPVVAALALLLLGAAAGAQNSTRKIRSEPGPLAARAGSAVRWRAGLGEALDESRTSGRPVFWYVPALDGSPMDRKPEIDRYALAGPFSDPRVVNLLNDAFVPVREVAGRSACDRFGLAPPSFVEPGWLVVAPGDPDDAGTRVVQRAHSMVTWSGRFVAGRLLEALAAVLPGNQDAVRVQDHFGVAGSEVVDLDRLDRSLAGGLPAVELLMSFDLLPGDEPLDPVAQYARGAALWIQRREDEARRCWAAIDPDSPWAWKAAMESEGHGPFVRGFETGVLLDGALAGEAGAEVTSRFADTWPAGRSPRVLQQAGLRFLLKMQRADGGFHDSIYDFGGTDSLPNVHVAVSALVGRWWLRVPEELSTPLLEERLEELFTYLVDDGNLEPEDRDEILWAQTYRIRFLGDWMRLRPDLAVRAAPHLERATEAVLQLQQENGAWFHEYPNPFVIATALEALAEARERGLEVPRDAVERGVKALLQCRAENGAYTYAYPRRRVANGSIPAAAGRMPVCELALLHSGAGGEKALRAAVEAAFVHYGELAKVRKYDDHASRLGYGGFFFWFDVLTRVEAMAALPEGPQREAWAEELRAEILSLAEIDGCFVDSHELGRCYGTASALLALALLDGML